MIAFVDCTAQSLGEGGYRAVTAPGSGLSVVVTALFTISVALIGYRMLLVGRPHLRDAMAAVVKIGVVLALTTGWPAYRTLFYDVALRAPGALGGTIGRPLDLPVEDGTLAARLQTLDAALATLARADPAGAMAMPPPPTPNAAAPQVSGAPGVSEVAGTLRSVRLIVMVTALGSLAATRLLAGALLAIGPLFVACLLLAATRGLFVGWLRVLGGATLGAFGAALTLGILLTCMEPMVVALTLMPDDMPVDADAVLRLLGLSLTFALVMLAMLIGTARVMAGLRWPQRPPAFEPAGTVVPPFGMPVPRDYRRSSDPPAVADRPRALATADAVAAQQRRERGEQLRSVGTTAAARARYDEDDGGQAGTPLGLTFRRQTRGRVSTGMTRRNAS